MTVFNQVNNLIDKGKVSIDGKHVAVEVFLGGDLYKVYFYKSIQLIRIVPKNQINKKLG